MGTTAQKLNKIIETKEAIRTAINNKGGTLTTTDTFASYPTAIDNLPSGGGVNPLQYIIDNHNGDNQPSGEYLFCEYWGSSLYEVINSCDFSRITSAYRMFYNCKNIKSIPYFNASNVTNMSYMFNGCSSLTTIPQLNTTEVTTMRNMFEYCLRLTTIDITHMNITSPSNSEYFASSCKSLTKLIIRNMDTIPNIASNAFNSCYHFTGTVNSIYNPQGLKDGRIYVPDDKVDALKTATNWSKYSDIIVPLSTLVE